MNMKQLKAAFQSQLGSTVDLCYIELPSKKQNDVPKVKTINHWKLMELSATHTFEKRDQEMFLPRFRRIK